MTQFWVNSKRVHFWGIWGTFAPFPGEPDFSWEIGLCYPNCIIALYHPAKFKKKLMSQSWDIECTYVRTYVRTDETEFIGPSRKRGSNKCLLLFFYSILLRWSFSTMKTHAWKKSRFWLKTSGYSKVDLKYLYFEEVWILIHSLFTCN